MTPPNFDLQRFTTAQDPIYPTVLAELRAGRKRTHWIWFVFPQITGLGHSAMARHYALQSLAEARAYLQHPVLGARLAECIAALDVSGDTDIVRILGDIDATKFRSCLTLFACAQADDEIFQPALERWFDGRQDTSTLRLIS